MEKNTIQSVMGILIAWEEDSKERAKQLLGLQKRERNFQKSLCRTIEILEEHAK